MKIQNYLYGSTQYNYKNLTASIYSQAFQNMNTATGKSNIDKSITSLSATRSTFVDKGMEMANGIFANNPISSGEKRERVVIVIMDGQPGSQGRWGYDTYGGNGNDGTTVANIVLPLAYETKNTYGATMYTIGVFSTADGSVPAPTPNWGDGQSKDSDKDNAFMHYLSSNFKNTKSVENPGNPTYPKEGSYYLSALNTSELNNIFTSIYEENVVGTSNKLDADTILKDIIAVNFSLPENATAADIKVYTSAYQGNGVFADKEIFQNATVNIYTDTTTGLDVVEVTGFDYSKNCVMEESLVDGNPKGAKIIVEIPIITASGNSGGTVQYTNDSLSGIYDSEGEVVESFLIEKFPIPAVDTPTTVTLKHILDSYDGDTVSFDFNSEYIKFVEYIEESNETGNYLKAVGQSTSETNSLANNASVTINDVIVNNEFKITSEVVASYEITKVTVSSPDVEEYEIQPDTNGDYSVNVINNMVITFYTEKSQRDIIVKKEWEDIDNSYNIRPESIVIELLKNGVVFKEAEITSENGWEYKFEELDTYDLSGNEYEYSIREKNSIQGYYVKSVVEENGNYVITNSKLGTITINKYDKLTQEPLENATFKIEKQNGEVLELIGEYFTDEDGKIIVENLEQGLYFITEIHAPEGYKLNKEVFEVDINNTKFDHEIDIPNKQQIDLPATGGIGVTAIVAIGIIFILLGNVLQKNKKKGK